MLVSNQRQRSKSSRRIRMKSPLGLRYKTSLDQNQKDKISRKSNGSTNDSNQSERNAFGKINQSSSNNKNQMKNWSTTEGFKNKIYVSSCEFNRLKQKLQSNSGSPKNIQEGINKNKNQKKLKIKILDGLRKHSSQNSDNNKTMNNSTGSSGSQEIELLKIQNQNFKKIYDQTLGELSKLKNKLKEQKKVHDLQKQIYENQINKLKRIVDSQKEQVSHIIYDDQTDRFMVVLQNNQDRQDQGDLGLESDCDESISNLSINSK